MWIHQDRWQNSIQPLDLLQMLGPKACRRKLVLLAAAFCRRVWPLLRDERSRQLVVLCEQKGLSGVVPPGLQTALLAALAAEAELRERADEVWRKGRERAQLRAELLAAEAARLTGTAALAEEPYHEVVAASTVAGTAVKRAARSAKNPGSPAAWEERLGQCQVIRDLFSPPRPATQFRSWPWQNKLVQTMARAIQSERRFEDLPILADVLEEAGCPDRDLLEHCRRVGPHFLGCWAVDDILGTTETALLCKET